MCKHTRDPSCLGSCLSAASALSVFYYRWTVSGTEILNDTRFGPGIPPRRARATVRLNRSQGTIMYAVLVRSRKVAPRFKKAPDLTVQAIWHAKLRGASA